LCKPALAVSRARKPSQGVRALTLQPESVRQAIGDGLDDLAPGGVGAAQRAAQSGL